MDSDGIEREDQEGTVKKDIQHLIRILTCDDLNPDIMFAKKRGIRSYVPDFTAMAGEGQKVADQLKRIPVPVSQD